MRKTPAVFLAEHVAYMRCLEFLGIPDNRTADQRAVYLDTVKWARYYATVVIAKGCQ